ncbi:hypothetical protein SOVF_157540 [Spinacia oleracea]|nr:hypothetical protein SOVF_157540 [Spinacia oleracea]
MAKDDEHGEHGRRTHKEKSFNGDEDDVLLKNMDQMLNLAMAFNLANMWSKCSGSHLPSELNLMTQGGSRSLLSQDIDLYSSIWFANVMDEIVRKEIGKEQIFFPIYEQSHCCVMCININNKTLDILDNKILEEGMRRENKYYDYPEKLLGAFSVYMDSLGHKLKRPLTEYNVRIIEMPWRNNKSNTDCGIYTMKHMETYHAKERWGCGLETDNNDILKQLRLKYSGEIISGKQNQKKADVYVKSSRCTHATN